MRKAKLFVMVRQYEVVYRDYNWRTVRQLLVARSCRHSIEIAKKMNPNGSAFKSKLLSETECKVEHRV